MLGQNEDIFDYDENKHNLLLFSTIFVLLKMNTLSFFRISILMTAQKCSVCNPWFTILLVLFTHAIITCSMIRDMLQSTIQ